MAVKYTKWIPSPLDGLSLEELLDELSEFFLQSGFDYGYPNAMDPHRFDALKQAILEKLVEMGRIPDNLYQQWLDDRTTEESRELDELLDQLIRRMLEEGYLRTDPDRPGE